LSILQPVILSFDNIIIKYPTIKHSPGCTSNDLGPDLQHPDNPLPLLKDVPEPHVQGGGG
jgi:arylsulfatase